MSGTINGAVIGARAIGDAEPIPGDETATIAVGVMVDAAITRRAAAAAPVGVAVAVEASARRRVTIAARFEISAQTAAHALTTDEDPRVFAKAAVLVGCDLSANLGFARLAEAPHFRRFAVPRQRFSAQVGST